MHLFYFEMNKMRVLNFDIPLPQPLDVYAPNCTFFKECMTNKLARLINELLPFKWHKQLLVDKLQKQSYPLYYKS